MPEERAFLDALAADPGDDVTRLVYADWLDERGDDRAAYLRGEVELAALADHDARHAPLAGRLRGRRQAIEPAWLARAGKRFDVVLFGYCQRRRVPFIKVHRGRTRCSLLEGKWVTSLLPCCVGLALPLDEAERLR